MEIIKQEEQQIQVRLAGEQLCLTTSNIKNLPEILKNEILYPKLNGKDEVALSSRKETTMKIISMLSVKFENENDMKLAVAEFGGFLKSYYLTGKEVIEAYRMALKRELFNLHTGEAYKVFPTLSLIQCGEILDLYQDYKANSNVRQAALKRLKSLTQNKEKPTEIDLEKINLEFEQKVYTEIKEKGFSTAADFYHEGLKREGKLKNWSNETKLRFYKRMEKRMLSAAYMKVKAGHESRGYYSKMKKDSESGVKRADVNLLCKRIMVCNYLKKYCNTFEEFRSALPKVAIRKQKL